MSPAAVSHEQSIERAITALRQFSPNKQDEAIRFITSLTPNGELPARSDHLASSAQLLELIGRECDSVQNFTDGVERMAGVIESMYHVVYRANEELDVDTEKMDWPSILSLLESSRATWPNIYSGLSVVKTADRRARGEL